MTGTLQSITLSEWETKSPEDSKSLQGRFLDQFGSARSMATSLAKARRLELTELRGGLRIRAFSHVGRIRLSGLTITVVPKLPGNSMLTLLRYAYGFRQLKLVSDTSHLMEAGGFEDLLVAQLNAEAQEIISRGLHRSHVARNDPLASPRGRIDVHQLARGGGKIGTSLPCRHHPRIEDTLLNRVLLAGLRLAASMTGNITLQRECRRFAAVVEEGVSRISLNAAIMDEADRQMNRLTKSYFSAMSIVRLLLEAQGVTLQGESVTNRLPGFLFDMNRFFQALLSRFLKENLVDCSVRDEHGLKGMMRYDPKHNPQHRQSPTPRPDYAIMRQGQLVALLDAKYRDLWGKTLPREMLYQLVVYAISHRHQLQSSILYPTTNVSAKEARIDVTDPLYGKHLGQVCLRPVHLTEVEDLVSSNTAVARRKRESLAKRLAFGTEP